MTIDVLKLRDKTRKLLSKKKVSQTLKLYETSLSKDPGHPDLWCELGSLQKSVGDAEGSGASYMKAAEIFVQNGQERHALAACKKAIDSGSEVQGARQLLKELATKIKKSARGDKPAPDKPPPATKDTTPSGSMVFHAARQSRVQLGRVSRVEGHDYDEYDLTPLPKPLSTLGPIHRRQSLDFVRQSAAESDLDDHANAPAAPAETFMVLSRRDPSMLLSGLRSGITHGISDQELAKMDAAAKSPDHRITEVLMRSLLFEGLSAELMAIHAPPARRRRAKVGEAVARSGSGGDSLFSILSGEVRVLSLRQDPPLEVARLGPGAIIGEQSFVGTVGMKTTVEVTREAELQVLDRAQAQELLNDHPASLYAMLRVVEERVLDNMLLRTGFFRLFEHEERDEICHRFEILEVANDEVIVEQGTPSKTLCLLMSGMLEMSHTNADGRTVKMLLDPGGGFGMESLIDGRPATFTARTTARSWILLLRREEYLKIYDEHPNLVRALKDVARRRRKTLAAANRGDLVLAEASWPDFDPQMRNAEVKKVRKDRSHSKQQGKTSKGDQTPSDHHEQ